jgi:hypothetical protein
MPKTSSLRSLLRNRRGYRLLQQKLSSIARALVPAAIALSFATVAHAQGTMDFSGAQTLMGTFNWRNDYVAVEQWSRNIFRDHYVYLVALHEQHERFARTWDANLKAQGYLAAFSDKCILGYRAPTDLNRLFYLGKPA